MKKEFIPYEQALELKELGFDEECLGLFNVDGLQYDGEIYCLPYKNNTDGIDPSIIAAPLWQQAFRWFREKYKLLSYIDDCPTETFRYNIVFDMFGTVVGLGGFSTYEEAELACLKKLIEIVKEK